MKKIFAIALALVMVLSMASAFAFVGTCGKYEYTCPTASCGVAKAEVVKFIANNTIDGFQESPDCAGIVVGQPIFYGVKVTFDKDVNEQWYYDDGTKLEVNETVNGVTTSGIPTGSRADKLCMLTGKKASAVSGKTYWVKWSGRPVAATLVEDWSPACVKAVGTATTRDNVSAYVKFDFNGVTMATSGLQYTTTTLPAGVTAPSTQWLDYGSFQVEVVKDYNDGTFGPVEYGIHVKQGGAEGWFLVIGGKVKYYAEPTAGGYNYYKEVIDNRLISAVTGQADGTCTDYATLAALIGIKLGDCVDGGTIKAIFGWADKGAYGNKATWNKDAVAIANAECQVQVEIPKTGDVSVVAYAVMALVAAAGAMGLKK